MMNQDDTLLTPNEVAALLRIPLRTLYYWSHRGEGPPAAKVGRHLRYRRSEVEAWLGSRTDTRNAQSLAPSGSSR